MQKQTLKPTGGFSNPPQGGNATGTRATSKQKAAMGGYSMKPMGGFAKK